MPPFDLDSRDIDAVAHALNSRPRKTLGWRTPAEAFNEYLQSTGVATTVEPGQYTSIRYTEYLELEGIIPSIGSIGDAYDNALMETINGLYKTECIHTTIFHDGPTPPAPTSSTPPLDGSTGTTTAASTPPSATPPAHHETIHYAATVQEKEPA